MARSFLWWQLSRWPLEFDDIPLGVCDIDRGAFALRAVTYSSWSSFHPVGFEMTPDALLIKRIHAEAEVVEIPPLLPRRGASCFPKHAAHRHEVEKRATRSKLNQADLV